MSWEIRLLPVPRQTFSFSFFFLNLFFFNISLFCIFWASAFFRCMEPNISFYIPHSVFQHCLHLDDSWEWLEVWQSTAIWKYFYLCGHLLWVEHINVQSEGQELNKTTTYCHENSVILNRPISASLSIPTQTTGRSPPLTKWVAWGKFLHCSKFYFSHL